MVPFGQTVDVLEAEGYGVDTVGYQASEDSTYQMPIHGEWVKIRHGRLKGYAFGAYLTPLFCYP